MNIRINYFRYHSLYGHPVKYYLSILTPKNGEMIEQKGAMHACYLSYLSIYLIPHIRIINIDININLLTAPYSVRYLAILPPPPFSPTHKAFPKLPTIHIWYLRRVRKQSL